MWHRRGFGETRLEVRSDRPRVFGVLLSARFEILKKKRAHPGSHTFFPTIGPLDDVILVITAILVMTNRFARTFFPTVGPLDDVGLSCVGNGVAFGRADVYAQARL